MSISKINFNDKNEAYIIINPISDVDKNDFKKYLDLDCPSFLKCEFENDKDFTLFYSYNNNVTLKKFISQEMDKKSSITFLKSLVNVYIETETHGLNPDHILLGINSVFCDPETNEVSCIYVPVNDGVLPSRPLRLFLKEILVNIIYSEDDNMEWLGNIIRYISKTPMLNYRSFYHFLETLEKNEMTDEKINEVSVDSPTKINYTEINIEKEIQNLSNTITSALSEFTQEDKVSHYLYRRSDHSMFILGRKKMHIGKSLDNEICVKDNPIISRVHAIINYVDDEYTIQDNGSTNHTFVNGLVLKPNQIKVLKSNDRILLGNEEFIFKVQ